jgi:hypothetical protein
MKFLKRLKLHHVLVIAIFIMVTIIFFESRSKSCIKEGVTTTIRGQQKQQKQQKQSTKASQVVKK